MIKINLALSKLKIFHERFAKSKPPVPNEVASRIYKKILISKTKSKLKNQQNT